MSDFSPATLRRHILGMAFRGQTVHSPCALSIVEILSVLYGGGNLRFNPSDPRDAGRDVLLLSKGHGVMALYGCLREIGWLSEADLQRYNQDGTLLHGLAESKVPGIEAATGSLGHGFPVATGMAFGLKRLGKDSKVFCIVGDGEINEGSNWEACLFAAHHGLDNLTLIVDANQFQAMGRSEEVLGLEPLPAKLQSFGFQVAELDGHDPKALQAAFSAPAQGRPKAVVARTVKGKGVAFMEGDNKWHYTRMEKADYEKALSQLEAGRA
jgi:transketolase